MTHPTFGYAPARACIFDLDAPDAPLPAGWSRDVAAWGAEPTSDAITFAGIERNAEALAVETSMVAAERIESAATLVTEKPQPALHPLDHDGNGKPGGSLPKAKRGRPAKARP